MDGELPADTAVPALLATQLMAAEVYARFLYLSSDEEAGLWKKMLADELEHVDLLKKLVLSEYTLPFTLPGANVQRMAEVCEHIAKTGADYFLLRLEGALRLECAELDFGLEGLMARRLAKNDILPEYAEEIADHLKRLLAEAERYAASPNIDMQMRRLRDLHETCTKDTISREREKGTTSVLR